MARSSLTRQVLALIKRNVLIKSRNKGQVLGEVLYPIYMVLILAMIKYFTSPSTEEAIASFPTLSLPIRVGTGQLYVSPNTVAIGRLMDRVMTQLDSSGPIKYILFGSRNESVSMYKKHAYDVVAGIDFADGMLRRLNYTIRMNHSKIASTELTALYSLQDTCRGNRQYCMADSYLKEGFITLQTAIDNAYIELKTGVNNMSGQGISSTQKFPKGAWTSDFKFIQVFAAIYLVLAFTPFINYLTVSVVAEKEKKIKESLRMVGMQDSAYWLSWGATYFVLLLIVIVVTVLIAAVTKLFSPASLFLFFLLLLFYGLSIITMSFMITPFFNKAQVAGAVAAMATLVISLLYLVVSFTRTSSLFGPPTSSIPVVGQVFLCLLSPVTLALAIDLGIHLDITYGGMTIDKMNIGEMPLYVLFIMLVFDFLLYGLLAVYFDNIIPGEYGQKRSPLYFLSRDYWCAKSHYDKRTRLINDMEMDNVVQSTLDNDTDRDLVENVAQEFQGKESIRLFNLNKVFTTDDKKVVAVDGICLDIYEGQITALLGHNGAGKTTLMNMLTGLLPVSSGSATIFGLDVSDPNAQAEIRTMTGVCPQQNILFDDLTCHEHLMFYANLKGVQRSIIASHVAETLRDVDLKEVADKHTKQLSGGQKRKLCVALSLIGNPKIIFLDEPTAGMDPYSRRHLWSLLKSRRNGRVILLTTHFMDEADILADRKAFLSKGKLQCVGSSLFLKNRFGVGYHLSMVIDPSAEIDVITQVIQSHVPEGKMDRSHGKELTYTLPIATISKFAGLFAQLDGPGEGSADSLRIRSYGVCMTTLEEVFLKIGIEESEESEDNSQGKIGDTVVTDLSLTDTSHPVEVTRCLQCHFSSHTLQRFWTLCVIRWLILKRSKSLIIARIILPLVFIVLAVLLSRFLPPIDTTKAKDPAALPLHPALYTNVSYVSISHHNPNMTCSLSAHGGHSSSDFISSLYSQAVGLSWYNESTDYMAVAPHYMGVNIHHVNINNLSVSVNVTALYNDSATHSLPVTVNVISNAVLHMLNSSTDFISVISKPWPDISLDVTSFHQGLFSSVMLLGFGLGLIAPSFGVTVVRDREIKIRGQLRLSSVSHIVYWLSTFIADFFQYLFAITFAIIVVLTAQVKPMMGGGAIIAMILLYLLYMMSSMLFAYVLSFAFTKHDSAQSSLTNLFIFPSLLPYLAVSMVDMAGKESTATILHNIFVFLDPPYVLFGGLYYIEKVYTAAEKAQHGPPIVPFYSYFEWSSNIPICLIAPTIHIMISCFLLRTLDVLTTGGSIADVIGVGVWWKSRSVLPDRFVEESVIIDEDSDVLEERKRVRNWDMSDKVKAPVVLVRNLRKEFPKTSGSCKCSTKEVKVAVCNNSFTVETGEVFGLLGPNGAGKTTTLNMIIAEDGPTRGEVFVAGYDVCSSLSSAFKHLGYCPQHDALWDQVTLEEHLQCFAALQGYSVDEASSVVDHIVKSLHLEEYIGKIAKNLSGGTKRKLSYAISMLGHPRVVLLDEPSTGMDPRSKRFLWDTISRTFKSTEQGAILTTHYMEEAESLCNRIAIMVNGRMQCLGTLQELKSKFGQGYVLEVKLNGMERQDDSGLVDRFGALDVYIQNIFTNANMMEKFGERVTYRVPQHNVNSLSQTFAALEEGKESLGIEDYSFSQSTLEQVFIEFAKYQYDDSSDDSDILSRGLSRQLSGETPQTETDTGL